MRGMRFGLFIKPSQSNNPIWFYGTTLVQPQVMGLLNCDGLISAIVSYQWRRLPP